MSKISPEQYYKTFPTILCEAMYHFSMDNSQKDGALKHVPLYMFCSDYVKKNPGQMPQPAIVARLLDKLCENQLMSKVQSGGLDSSSNKYICVLDKTMIAGQTNSAFKLAMSMKLNMIAYGFPVIYDYYSGIVLPIEHSVGDKKSLGTSFMTASGLVTARHCLEGATAIAIRGFDPKDLDLANILVHKNKNFDIAIIKPPKPMPMSFIPEVADPVVLDPIITLGYPIVPGYQNFLAAERADVSSRFIVTKGAVAAVAEDIWLRERLALITARIRGGNSGGPVINEKGRIVGVGVQAPDAKDEFEQYDEMGYGAVIPLPVILEELAAGNFQQTKDFQGKFTDFV